MKPVKLHSGAAKQRGLAMVEFTIVLPLLLLLMLATAEFGRALFQYNTLTKAVRDGARYWSSNAYSGSGTEENNAARTAARNLVLCGKTTCADGDALLPGMTLDKVTAAFSGIDHVTMSAQYAYQPILGPVLPTFGLGSNISLNFTLSATVTMRVI